ncbi:MAG: hypothetical protein HY331_18505, partial [Chloroflexi bacterium]|nr:hypothetical protein [Chloroflexota bacterium]
PPPPDPQAALARLPTGIVGLDRVLAGGLVRGGSYLIVGRPGTGKTVLANHIAYNHARAGGVALYATTLTETHGWMVAHLRDFRFFDPDLVAQRVHYVSIYGELGRSGLANTLAQVRRLVHERRAGLLILDGAAAVEDFADSPAQYRQFIYELHTQVAVLGCTSLILAEHERRAIKGIGAIVDGILALEDTGVGRQDVRLLRLHKIRGVDAVRGRHVFTITGDGIAVYPRPEVVPTDLPPIVGKGQRLAFGVPALDAMLGGGIPASTTTLVAGAPGTGKTFAGLHFVVEGARRGERGLIVGFRETPPDLIDKAESVGLELGRHVREGRIRLLWEPPGELLVEVWTHRVLAAVADQRPQRLLVDAITDVQHRAVLPDRLPTWLTALTAELRALGVTPLHLAETDALAGASLALPLPALSPIVDNVLLLRSVELRSQLHRLIVVVKVRRSGHDTSTHELLITDRGIEVAPAFDGASDICGEAQMIPPAQVAAAPVEEIGR